MKYKNNNEIKGKNQIILIKLNDKNQKLKKTNKKSNENK